MRWKKVFKVDNPQRGEQDITSAFKDDDRNDTTLYILLIRKCTCLKQQDALEIARRYTTFFTHHYLDPFLGTKVKRCKQNAPFHCTIKKFPLTIVNLLISRRDQRVINTSQQICSYEDGAKTFTLRNEYGYYH